jgi:hypothetical protein
MLGKKVDMHVQGVKHYQLYHVLLTVPAKLGKKGYCKAPYHLSQLRWEWWYGKSW